MDKKLVINVADHETRVALVEDGTIAELFINRMDDAVIAGNIYKGRVQRVLPGMQAAFVDIGLDQAAFIYVNDVVDNQYRDVEAHFLETEDDNGGSDGEPVSDASGSSGGYPQRPIEELLVEGQDLLVHVSKSPIGTKGARVTTHISLPGRFLVLMPTSDHVGVSRRIEDDDERKRLKSIIQTHKNDGYGYIVRTASEGLSEDKLIKEMAFLKNLWDTIQNRYRSAPTPSLLHQELDVSLRAVRDLLTHEVEKLVIDSTLGYQRVLSFLDTFMPGMKHCAELYAGSEPIFDAFNLEGDISRALKRKVWLKSGGYIVIEETEALVAIDVNTGRYVGKHNLEETILKTNLEAVKEIAYQIRLRDTGGLIIIDFIDMEKSINQEKTYSALKEALKRDRSKTHVLPISELGLVQMTRKRVKQSLASILREPCFYCEGEGYLISRRTVCHTIYRSLIRDTYDMVGDYLTLRANPEIAELLHGEENRLIRSIESRTGKQVEIYPDDHYHLEEYDIFESLRD
ncbi:MAG: Rne/Rng family ribonuclease [Pseudomonadota bacterium]